MAELWLVRTSKNRILGPFPKTELCVKISRGDYEVEDEVCAANRYWLGLHEKAELGRQLGVEVPKKTRSDKQGDETTDTEIGGEKTDSAILAHTPESQMPRLAALVPQASLEPALERTSIFRILAWLMAVFGLVILMMVLRVLRSA